MENPADRRKFPRYKINIPIYVQIIIPEDTFKPKFFQGNALNISLNGMLISITDMELDLYKKLLHPNRYIKVQLPDSPSDLPSQLIGKVVWMDYHVSTKPDYCNVGLYFENLEPEAQEQIEKFINKLPKTGN